MEKNDFLLYNEIIYRIHACRTLEEFRPTLLAQVKLIIPYTYASLIAIQTDPETGELIHRDPYCKPQNFREVENAWLGRIDKAYTAWLSHAPESMVVRDSEILSGDKRFSAASYRELYTAYHVHDCMQMNITYAGQAMGRLALYRTRGTASSPTRRPSISAPWPTTSTWPAGPASRTRTTSRNRPEAWKRSSGPMT